MKTVIQTMVPTPYHFLFARGRRLPQKGLRWAPVTLISPYGLPSGYVSLAERSLSDEATITHMLPLLSNMGLWITLPTLKICLDLSSQSPNAFWVQFGSDVLKIGVGEPNKIQALESEGLTSTKQKILYLVAPPENAQHLSFVVLLLKHHDLLLGWKAKYLSLDSFFSYCFMLTSLNSRVWHLTEPGEAKLTGSDRIQDGSSTNVDATAPESEASDSVAGG